MYEAKEKTLQRALLLIRVVQNFCIQYAGSVFNTKVDWAEGIGRSSQPYPTTHLLCGLANKPTTWYRQERKSFKTVMGSFTLTL